MDKNMIAYIFDIEQIKNNFYGEAVFELLIKNKEMMSNKYKMIFSVGDIIDENVYDDITPFVINDEICTVVRNGIQCINGYHAVLVEDIETNIAQKIDTGLRNESEAYVGMTSIDKNSTDRRKQFWKRLIRKYSVESNIITLFG